MVHVAMHDAIQAIEQRYEPYGLPIAGATGSPIAAAATAAHDVLANPFSSSAGSLATPFPPPPPPPPPPFFFFF